MKIVGNTVKTPLNPNKYGGNGGGVTESDKAEIVKLAKKEIAPIIGDINSVLESIIARQSSVIGGIN